MTARECGHEHITTVQGMPRCASCAIWIPTGRGGKCGIPLDDKPHFGALACDAGKGP